MNKRLTVVIAIGLATASALSGCTGTGGTGNVGAAPKTAAAKTGYKLTASFPNSSLGDPFWVSIECGANQQAKKLGSTITFKDSPDADTSHVAQALDAAALTQPDALITAGGGQSANNAKIQSIQAGGTPVVVAANANNPEVAYADVVSSTDNSEFAKYVANDIGASSGSVGILGGIAGYAILDDRWKPMAKALKAAAPGITVLSPQYDSFDRTKASSATSALIAAHPDLKAVYAVSGPEGGGAAAAVKQAGKTGQIKVYTYDATPEIVQGIKTGVISAALSSSPYKMAANAVTAAVDYLKSGSSGPVKRDASKDQMIPLKVLDKSNIDDAASQPYQYKATCQ